MLFWICLFPDTRTWKCVGRSKTMPRSRKSEKQKFQEETFLRFYNQGVSNKALAEQFHCSERTIIRWKTRCKTHHVVGRQIPITKRERQRRFDPLVFQRMIVLKEEVPTRSAPTIHSRIRQEFPEHYPSESTIRKYLIAKGYQFKKIQNRAGYIKFEREKANDLWQIDIAGVQTIAYLGKVYLIAILDDCSRYVVAAQYFRDQSSPNVMKVIRTAITTHGRPNQIIADNGSQFKNVIGDLNTRYVNLLVSLGIKPLFSRSHHPQSKGKLERWFGTVIQSFLPEIRSKVKQVESMDLFELNQIFSNWLQWYNYEKPHRSLPHRMRPAQIFMDPSRRISRPLESQVNWNEWINRYLPRKVSKYNVVSYKGQALPIPAGYVGCGVDLLELDDRIEIYHNDTLICTHTRTPDIYLPGMKSIIRTIAQNGTIQYRKHWYNLNYKLSGKKVEIQESTDGAVLLVYLNRVLLKQFPLVGKK